MSVYGNLMGEYVHAGNAAFDETSKFYFQERDRLPQYVTEEVSEGV